MNEIVNKLNGRNVKRYTEIKFKTTDGKWKVLYGKAEYKIEENEGEGLNSFSKEANLIHKISKRIKMIGR